MKLIRQLLKNELQHYQKLNQESKVILIAIFIFNLASPILSTFINAFLWRSVQDIQLVVLYNIASFIGIPLGFYLNGELLKKYYPTTLYFFGSIAQGIVAAVLLFFPHFNSVSLLLFGLIFGTTSGLYWGNRIYLVSNYVKSYQRIYFMSLVFMQSTLCGIILPFIIGWYLVIGERTSLYSADLAYKVLGIGLVMVLAYSGYKIKKLVLEKQPIPYTSLHKPSASWKKVRGMAFIMGITNSIDFIFPTILVLQFVGKEGKLGTIQALSGIVLAFAIYQIGKKVDRNHRFTILFVGVFLSIVAGLIFSFSYSAIGVLFYFVLTAFASPFRWTVVSPVMFDVMDGEVRKYAKNRYAFVYDQELFLNIGRNVSLLLFVFLYANTPTIALRFTPLLFALPQFVLLYIALSLEEGLISEYVEEKKYLYQYVMAVYRE